MQREDVERLAERLDKVTSPLLSMEAATVLRSLLAERDAAFAAGQESMRERAAALAEPGQHDGWFATIKRQVQARIRDLPIKPRP